MPHQQVAGQRLARYEEFRREGVPRASEDSPFRHQLLELRGPFGADVQVIVQHGGLTVRVEIGEVGILLHDGDKIVHRLRQPELGFGERPAILAIPMRINNQMHVVHTSLPLYMAFFNFEYTCFCLKMSTVTHCVVSLKKITIIYTA